MLKQRQPDVKTEANWC